MTLYHRCPIINPKWLAIALLYCLGLFASFFFVPLAAASQGLPLYYWQQPEFVNFGDYISLKLVERIVATPVKVMQYRKPKNNPQKLLAIGSILFFANENDVVWGTGINGKQTNLANFQFSRLDVRAVRGPLTRDFLFQNFGILAPEVYGDPALLFPYFFPEFRRKENPKYEYLIIPHYSEIKLFPKSSGLPIAYPTDPWEVVIDKILDSKFVISSSLHGIIIAEAYGIPARMLRVTPNEPLLKYHDYYLGTQRPSFDYAASVEQALKMGGEPPFKCDLKQLYEAFPFEFWPYSEFKHPNFRELTQP